MSMGKHFCHDFSRTGLHANHVWLNSQENQDPGHMDVVQISDGGFHGMEIRRQRDE